MRRKPGSLHIDMAPLISEACFIYKWSFEEVLKTEVRAFFKMLEEGRKLQVGSLVDQCLIASISIADGKHMEKVIEGFENRIQPSPEAVVKAHELAEASELKGKAAKRAVFAMFSR